MTTIANYETSYDAENALQWSPSVTRCFFGYRVKPLLPYVLHLSSSI